ncbi:MAG TPA: SPW repeat protein [Steroidobacteraceae bacterium]|nr:SPW repeat protein [Steroidobacteraceae bacterium]
MQGGPDLGDQATSQTEPAKNLRGQFAAATSGVTLPWPLLATCAVGVLLMFSGLLFDAQGPMANSDHVVGALLITIAGIATAEVARALRFLNVLVGLWLIAAPWLLSGVTVARAWYAIAAGVMVIALSLPRGRRSQQHYGSWDGFVV